MNPVAASSPKLRTRLTLITISLAILTLMVSAALVVLTSVLRETTDALRDSVESVRLAEEAEIALLLHARAKDPAVRRELESNFRDHLVSARSFASAVREVRTLDEVERRLDLYLATAREPARSPADVDAALDSAYGAFEEFIEINVTQARSGHSRAETWLGVANALAAASIGLLVAVMGGSLYWLWARAFQPMFTLASAIDRFASGDRAVRLSAAGSDEVRTIIRGFNALADALAAQRQMQSAFLAGVAHDLRNPLSALKLSLAVISPDMPLPPEARIRRVLTMLERQLAHAERMLDDFLDITKIEAGELKLQWAEHDVRLLIQHVAELFEASPQSRRIHVGLPEHPVLLRCDGLRVEQAVANLVSNALKYSNERTSITLSLHTEQDGAVIEVADHGVGIPEQDRVRLFQPFSRAPGAAAHAPGLGIGLFMVRSIVSAHKGRIELDSAEGKGSTFRIRLAREKHADRVAEPRLGAGVLPSR
jgi:signal transduction histidine kinase